MFIQLPNQNKQFSTGEILRYLEMNDFTFIGQLTLNIYSILKQAIPLIKNYKQIRLINCKIGSNSCGNVAFEVPHEFYLAFTFTDSSLKKDIQKIQSSLKRNLNVIVTKTKTDIFITVGMNYEETRQYNLPFIPSYVYFVSNLILNSLMNKAFTESSEFTIYTKSNTVEFIRELPLSVILKHPYYAWRYNRLIWQDFSNLLTTDIDLPLALWVVSNIDIKTRTPIIDLLCKTLVKYSQQSAVIADPSVKLNWSVEKTVQELLHRTQNVV